MDDHGVATVSTMHEAATQEIRFPVQGSSRRSYLVEREPRLDGLKQIAAYDGGDRPVWQACPFLLGASHDAYGWSGDPLVSLAEGIYASPS